MAETRYVIDGSIIPAAFDDTHPLISEGSISIGTADRRITNCYALWKSNICRLNGYYAQRSESGWAGSGIGTTYVTYYYSFSWFGMSGKRLDSWANSSTDGYPGYYNTNSIRLKYEKRSCYTTHLSHTGNGTVNFFLPKRSVTISATFFGNLGGSWSVGASETIGGAVSEADFNSAAPLHLGGESVKFQATPGARCRVKCWRVNNAIIANSQGMNELSISLYSSDMNIVCEFEQYLNPVTVICDKDESIGRVIWTNTEGEVQGGGTFVSQDFENDVTLGLFTAKVVDDANYRFVGWYKRYADNASADACTTLVQSSEVLTLVTEAQAVTYCAKFVSRVTKLKVDVASSKENGVGTFDITVNDNTLFEQTAYENEDARDGWRVTLNAKPINDYSYFDYWLVPLGNAATETRSTPTFSFELLTRADNAFTAYFAGKTKKNLSIAIGGIGKVAYDYFDTTGSVTSERAEEDDTEPLAFYEESDVIFTAEPTSKLYAFAYWEYAIGSTWAELTNEAKPTWVRSVTGNKVVTFFPKNSGSPTGLRAVFRKLKTYTIARPVIKGDHPLTKAEANASDSGCKVSELPEADDKGADNEPRWLEGTTFELTVTQGAKWVVNEIEVIFEDGKTTYHNGETSVKVTVTDNITAINVVFSARKYLLTPEVERHSAVYGIAKLTYHDDSNEPVTTSHPVHVYVDDVITLSAETVEEYGDKVTFFDWKQNGIETTFPAEQEVKVTGESVFTARFATRQAFRVLGSITEGDGTSSTIYPLGDISISYTKDGYVTDLTLPTEEDETEADLFLVCGSTITLEAKARSFTSALGTPYTGYFKGWFDESESLEEIGQIVGWGERVESVEIGAPRHIKAVFVKENRWPILSLRNPPGTQYAAFAVAGARPDRSQKITDKETVTLVNPNDYFCDPFSVVQIRLDKYNSNDRFSHWVTFSRDVDADGKEVLAPSDETYSSDQDLSVFMTSNLSLMPIFYTGNPIDAEAALADGVDSSWGAVSLDGEPIKTSEEGNYKASFMQGDTAYFVANPSNGYRFVGWSANSDGSKIVSTDARYAVTMDVTRKYYAVFEKDRNAIFIFGEGKAVKRMVWHSKRVELNTPTSFSVAKVDAEGYKIGLEALQLTVFKASSPDVPKNGKVYSIKDSNTRRLALDGRGEKAYEFEVSGSTPINKVQIATSVTSLLGGS